MTRRRGAPDLAAIAQRARRLSRPYRVVRGKGFRLSGTDPGDTGEFGAEGKPQATEILESIVQALSRLQERLYVQDRWALLVILQGMDASGKDGIIEHVMAGINPLGCQIVPFKAPSAEELDHDFLWRCWRRLPERGQIGIFNRSYYEETLIVRVHPELLAAQKLPPQSVGRRVWSERFEDIRNAERYLTRNGLVVRKFFLHLSPEEQKRRFLARIEDPEKNWKLGEADVRERERWADYMAAYEDTVRNTTTEHAPWYVVPADHKWFTRLVVGAAILDALSSLDLRLPPLSAARRKELAAARRALLEADRDLRS